MEDSFLRVFRNGCRRLDLALPPQAPDQCVRYFSLLEEWNRRISLTALTRPEEAAEKLFLDSLCLLPQLQKVRTLLDIGSGAGFPGLVLKIARPDLSVHLVDSIRKKVSFLKEVILTLGLRDVRAHHLRLGGEGSPQLPGGAFDAVTFRAVGSLESLAETALPYLAPQGMVIAMKGPAGPGEGTAFSHPGLTIREIVAYTLPFSGLRRTLVILGRNAG